MDNENFFSVERLVEFGLGMAMARQMVEMFNQTMTPMNYMASANAQNSMTPQPSIFYVGIEGRAVGPLHEFDIVQYYQKGKINKDSLAWMPGMSQWLRIEEVPAILKVIAMVPPTLPNVHF